MIRKKVAKQAVGCLVALTMMMTNSYMGINVVGRVENVAYAEDELTYTVGNSRYSYEVLEDGSIEITDYEGTDTEIVIPAEIDGNSVTSIGEIAFSGCSSLTSIEIPNSVTSIGDWAFSGCSNLTGIEIPDNVTYMNDGIFYNCTSLTSIEIPEGVTGIGEMAFDFCYSLKRVKIPNSVTYIGKMAFDLCDSLAEIEIPDSVTDIDEYAFCGCISLARVEIPNSVINIGKCAFYRCDGLTSIEIPNSVNNIGDNAFILCKSLEMINVDEENKYYKSQDGILFNIDMSTIIQYPAGKKNESYIIPNSVTNIGGGAFYRCYSLTSVEIPASVTYIGYEAFEGCDNITIYGEKASYAEEYANENDIPFVAINTISDNITNIEIKYTENTISENISLKTKQLTSTDEEYKNIILADKIADSTVKPEDVKFSAYDISLVDENSSPVQPIGTVTVKIPCPADYNGENCKVYSVEEAGGFKNMDAKYQNGYMVFGTDHFSTYIITETELITQPDGNMVRFHFQNGCNWDEVGGYIYQGVAWDTNVTDNSVVTVKKSNGEIKKLWPGARCIEERKNWYVCTATFTDSVLTDGMVFIFNNLVGYTEVNDIMDEEDVKAVLESGIKTKPNATSLQTQSILIFKHNPILSGGTIPTDIYIEYDGDSYTVTATPPDSYLNAEEFSYTVGDSKYHYVALYDGTVEITGYEGTNTEIVIPSKIDGKNVTGLGSQVFSEYDNITIYGKEGSIAEEYANENNIPFKPLKTLSEDITNIKIEYTDNRFSTNVSLLTKRVLENDEEYKKIIIADKIVDSSIEPENVKFCAYDISLLDENSCSVQPVGTVAVNLPCPVDYAGERCKVYRVEENGEFTDMNAYYEDGYIVFNTDHFSTYIITETELVTGTDVVKGDANGDGNMDIKDSAIIKRYLAGWDVEIDMTAADMDGDGKVTIKDSALIKRQLAGWE